MYTNVDVDHSIQTLNNWFNTYNNELPPDFPPSLILTATEIVIKNNTFIFGDTYWLQKTGTAMETPCACVLASLYFGFYECSFILRKYQHHILFYRCFINDVICLWKTSHNNILETNLKFEEFKINEMNQFGKLCWEFSPLQLQHF